MTARWLALLSVAANAALGASPSISRIVPGAFHPGAANEVVIHGSNLEEASALWLSVPASVRKLTATENKIECSVVFAPDAFAGICGVRVFASNGVSNLRLMMVDDLRSVAEADTNRTREATQRLPWPCAVDGVAHELGFNWFRISVRKHQRVSLEVVAARLGSRLDSVLRVLGGDGREVAYNDDVPGIRADSYVAFVAPREGEYFVELRDVNYGGGDEFRFRLRAGDFPMVTTTFPVAVEQGKSAEVSLIDIAGGARTLNTRAEDPAHLPLSVTNTGGASFGQALVVPFRQFTEREPNDGGHAAIMIELPGGLNGRFDQRNDRDVYEFSAVAQQRLSFRARTRSVGSACDVVLRLETTDGKVIAESNPSAADEGTLIHMFAKTGVHHLVVREAAGVFGPGATYWIEASAAPGFALSLDADKVEATPGGKFDLKVTCTRGDYKDAIVLGALGLEGAQLTNNVIARGATNTTMEARLPADFSPGAVRHFTIFGVAETQTNAMPVRASTAVAWRRIFPQMLHVSPEFEGVIAMGVKRAE